VSKILCDVTEEDIPDELVERLNTEKQLEIVRQKEKVEDHLYMNIRLIFEDSFVGHQVLVENVY
jgi:ubiquitin carboxyl-terminal hydrolase 7